MASPELQQALHIQRISEQTASKGLRVLAYIRREIRSPLSGIIYSKKLMEGTDLNDEHRNIVRTSLHCQSQMNKILEDTDLDHIIEGCLLGFLTLDESFLLENRSTLRAISEFGALLIYFYICDSTNILGESKKETIDEVLREGGDADAVLPDGKHGPDWLVGRQGSLLALENTPAIPQPSADELTAKITRDLESQMEAKVNRKVQENMTWFLKKLGEANPTLKFDIGDFCATFSSDQDECDTPITQTPGGATS
ncbi:hypothetical protein OROMI_005146 [Orobanche minor]